MKVYRMVAHRGPNRWDFEWPWKDKSHKTFFCE